MRISLLIPLALLLAAAGCGPQVDPEYQAEIDRWHAERIEGLRSDSGWLTLVGLHELKQGSNFVGSAEKSDVVLIDKAPPELCLLAVDGSDVFCTSRAGQEIYEVGAEDDGPLAAAFMRTDAEGDPTILSWGALLFHVIDRDGKLLLRVKDREAAALQEFEGIDRYPVNEKWRVEARLEEGPETVNVPNALGQESESPSPGVLVFRVAGQELRLTPTGEPGGGPMFLVFGDATNGKGTYPGGRFLSVEAPDQEGHIVVDFNKAYNPPCVFTPYATCPLPAAGNTLPVAVQAGEKIWGHGH